MKNALFLVGIWVGIILFAYSVVYLSGERQPVVTLTGDVEVTDGAHGIALPLPTGWTLKSTPRSAVLGAPISGIEAWGLTVPATSVDEALAQAWEVLDPCASCDRSPTLGAAPLSGGRDGAALELGPDGEGRTGRAVVLVLEESARVLLVRLAPGLDLPVRVEGDLSRILAGFRVFVLTGPSWEPEEEPVASLGD